MKQQPKDFLKKKVKVGRKVQKANATKIKIQSKKIRLPTQSISSNITLLGGDEETNRFNKLQQKLHHSSDSIRLEGLIEMEDFLHKGNHIERFLCLVLPDCLEQLLSIETKAREVILRLIEYLLVQYQYQQRLVVHDCFASSIQLVVTFLCSGMTSVNKLCSAILAILQDPTILSSLQLPRASSTSTFQAALQALVDLTRTTSSTTSTTSSSKTPLVAAAAPPHNEVVQCLSTWRCASKGTHHAGMDQSATLLSADRLVTLFEDITRVEECYQPLGNILALTQIVASELDRQVLLALLREALGMKLPNQQEEEEEDLVAVHAWSVLAVQLVDYHLLSLEDIVQEVCTPLYLLVTTTSSTSTSTSSSSYQTIYDYHAHSAKVVVAVVQGEEEQVVTIFNEALHRLPVADATLCLQVITTLRYLVLALPTTYPPLIEGVRRWLEVVPEGCVGSGSSSRQDVNLACADLAQALADLSSTATTTSHST
eukprot:gene6934-7672_t